jgi:hypothetical protein
MKLCGSYLSLPRLFHLTEWFPFPFILLQMTRFHSFYGRIILPCACVPHSFICPSADRHVRCFNFLLLWLVLQWTWECKYLFYILTSFLVDIYLVVKLLGHMIVHVLKFCATSTWISIMTTLIYTPTNNMQVFPFLSSPVLLYL